MDRDSDSSDRFHWATGTVVAKPRTRKVTATRRQPGATNRPAVQAKVPQATAATTAWTVTITDPLPAAFRTRGVRGGRGPAHRPRDHTDRWAMAA